MKRNDKASFLAKEFPIGDSTDTSEKTIISDFVHGLIQSVRHDGSSDKGAPAPAERPHLPAHFVKALVGIATQAWKLKVRMLDPATQEAREEHRKLYRHVESILDSLNEIGLQLRDRTNEAFDYGLPEKVIGTQPTPGITKERVIETIKPSIYWEQHLLQVGEVVVATPVSTDGAIAPAPKAGEAKAENPPKPETGPDSTANTALK